MTDLFAAAPCNVAATRVKPDFQAVMGRVRTAADLLGDAREAVADLDFDIAAAALTRDQADALAGFLDSAHAEAGLLRVRLAAARAASTKE